MPAIISAALLAFMALAGCGKTESPDGDPAPAATPEPPYQSPQDTAPAPDTMPPASDMPPSQTDEGNPAFGEPTPPPTDSPSEPPPNPSG
jgi:hypothetical protein